jgi:hypothetical protein
MEDYVWSDGDQEVQFESFDSASTFFETKNDGKLWHRRFDDAGQLEGVTDVTPTNSSRGLLGQTSQVRGEAY